MAAVGAEVLKRVKQPAATLAVSAIAVADLGEHVYFVARSLGVVGRRLLDFEGRKTVGVAIVHEPNSGEVTPAKLAKHTVAAAAELVPDTDGMIAPCMGEMRLKRLRIQRHVVTAVLTADCDVPPCMSGA